MDITRQIHDAENNLREFIHQMMVARHGEHWYTDLPSVAAMNAVWEKKKLPDELGHKSIKGNERSIQYASVEDIRKLIKEHWGDELHELYDDPATLDVYLKILGDFRDPDSRRRELFVHQKHLLLGISGDIKNRIAIYRSRNETGGLYARMDSVRDNLGNGWAPGDPRKVRTGRTLRVGEEIEYIVTSSDPEDLEMQYRSHHGKWQTNHIIKLTITRAMVEEQSLVHIMVKAARKSHAYPMGFDDRVTFEYEVTL